MNVWELWFIINAPVFILQYDIKFQIVASLLYLTLRLSLTIDSKKVFGGC